MIAALLALTILWPAVVADCAGGPEAGVVYEVAYLYRACAWVAGCDDCQECGTFAVRFETRDTSWSTEIGSDPPPVGAGYFFEVRDHDGAGHWSNECAQ